ncbi:uncharacterized protein LOC121417113 isoform X2 [Lytechinus variegatus]|uniref:uncharacterized protein LOC121417113 isoform X2 n=1 Tax=Lytechinus variegatus TaxID=7654 RepID=UPI001BB0F989|nr:uncharacterized protein LOC121417113 isoform X2 [Lytechinus variegatus]
MSCNEAWTREAIRLLLEFRADENVKAQMDGTSKNQYVYQQIAKALAECGVRKTRLQVKNKLKYTKVRWFQSLRNVKSGCQKKVGAFDALCKAIWGDDPLCQNPEANGSMDRVTNENAARGPKSALSGEVQVKQEVSSMDSAEGDGDEPSFGWEEDSSPLSGSVSASEDEDQHAFDQKMKVKQKRKRMSQSESEDDNDGPLDRRCIMLSLAAKKRELTVEDQRNIRKFSEEPGPSINSSLRALTARKRRKVRDTWLEEITSAVSRVVGVQLDRLHERFRRQEEERLAAQRVWEEKMERRHQESQRKLVEELNAGQMQVMDMFTKTMCMMTSGAQHPSQLQPGEGVPLNHHHNQHITGVWTLEEEKLLLQFRAEKRVRERLDGTCNNKHVYRDITKKLAERGVVKEAKAVRNKLKYLRSKWQKALLRDGSRCEGEKKVKIYHRELCAAIWGHNPGGMSDGLPKKLRDSDCEDDDDDDEDDKDLVEHEANPIDTVDAREPDSFFSWGEESSSPSGSNIRSCSVTDEGACCAIGDDLKTHSDASNTSSVKNTDELEKSGHQGTMVAVTASVKEEPSDFHEREVHQNPHQETEEDEHLTAQQAWEKRMERIHQESQAKLIGELRAGQEQFMDMFTKAMGLMTPGVQYPPRLQPGQGVPLNHHLLQPQPGKGIPVNHHSLQPQSGQGAPLNHHLTRPQPGQSIPVSHHPLQPKSGQGLPSNHRPLQRPGERSHTKPSFRQPNTSWTKEEELLLLKLRAEKDITDQMDGTCKNHLVYQQIEERLAECGIMKGTMVIRNKLKYLRKKWHYDLEHNNRKRKFGPLYQLCEIIWGHPSGPGDTDSNMLDETANGDLDYADDDDDEDVDDDMASFGYDIDRKPSLDATEGASSSSHWQRDMSDQFDLSKFDID